MQIYVYNISNYEEDNIAIKKLIENGSAVFFGQDQTRLLSKDVFLSIDNIAIKPECDLKEFIDYYNDGSHVTVTNDLFDILEIGIEESISYLQENLYSKDDSGFVYAERIYNSDNPEEETSKILDECVIPSIYNRIEKYKKKAEEIKQNIKDGIFEWK